MARLALNAVKDLVDNELGHVEIRNELLKKGTKKA